MGSRLFGARPLSKPMLSSCQLNRNATIIRFNMSFAKWQQFRPGLNVLHKDMKLIWFSHCVYNGVLLDFIVTHAIGIAFYHLVDLWWIRILHVLCQNWWNKDVQSIDLSWKKQLLETESLTKSLCQLFDELSLNMAPSNGFGASRQAMPNLKSSLCIALVQTPGVGWKAARWLAPACSWS